MTADFSGFILKAVTILVPMILALTVHEYSHALTAYLLKDDTARSQGRMTLNPLSHIDPIGTLLIPLIGIGTNFPFIGWAKPVPYNPVRLTRKFRMKTATLFVAIAGPISNFIFAGVCFLGIYIWYAASGVSGMEFYQTLTKTPVGMLLYFSMIINIALAFFNMIPIPPLDGSKVLAGLLPDRFTPAFEYLERYSFILFILLLVTGAFKFIGYPVTAISNFLLESIIYG